MADYSERATSGGVYKPLSVRHKNAMIDLAEQRLDSALGGSITPPRVLRRTDTILLKNSSGSDQAKGRILQLDALLNDDEPKAAALLFDGVDPAPDGSDTIAILLEAAKDTKVAEAQISGIAYARLDVAHIQHKWADIDTGEHVLTSHWHGRCEILWTSTATTGEQDAIVRIGQMFRGPIKAVITESGGIASGGSGEVTIWVDGVKSSPAATETAWLNWMTAGIDGAEDAECLIQWFPDEQKYVIIELECAT